LSRLLFISDLHLSPARPRLLERFGELLEAEAGCCDALYILGDLFDAWIGDDDPSPFADEVRGRMRAFSGRSRLFFQRGNRDFLVGERFASETGAVLLEDEHLLRVGGLEVLLLHGDQLCTADTEYQAVRRELRSPGFRERMQRLGIEERRALAAEFRRRSGESQSLKPADITDVSREAVASVARDHGIDLLIHGHTHRPAIHELEVGGRRVQRVVLPDWRESEPRVGFCLEESGHRWLELPPA